MNLTTAINQARTTKRSSCLVVACKAKWLTSKLDWLESMNGDRTIKEMLEERIGY